MTIIFLHDANSNNALTKIFSSYFLWNIELSLSADKPSIKLSYIVDGIYMMNILQFAGWQNISECVAISDRPLTTFVPKAKNFPSLQGSGHYNFGIDKREYKGSVAPRAHSWSSNFWPSTIDLATLGRVTFNLVEHMAELPLTK